jgi:hypothetical protein
MDTLIDLAILLAPAVIGLVCIVAASLAPTLRHRR